MEAPEFSRAIDVADIPPAGLVEDIAATPEERAALARRFGLLSLDRLDARLTIKALHGGLFRVEGDLVAEVTQRCVVSLEPVPARLAVPLVATFVKASRRDAVEVHLDGAGEEDDPEPLADGRIDLGETVAQHLALALDPYPRKPGVDIGQVIGAVAGETHEEPTSSPFSKLSEFKKKLT